MRKDVYTEYVFTVNVFQLFSPQIGSIIKLFNGYVLTAFLLQYQ